MTRIIEVIRRGRKGDDGLSNLIGVRTLSADVTLSNDDSGKAIRCTDAMTITIPDVVSAGWSVFVDADGGNVTLSSGANINGSASDLVVTDGNSAMLYSDGTAHYCRFFVANALTSIAATGVGFSPITGNSATDVQAAIAVNTGLWNAVTAYGKSLIAAASASAARTVLGLGNVATLTAGTSANNVVQLDGSAKLPAVDGSALTNIPTAIPAAVIEEQKADGTAGTSLTIDTWVKLELNTLVRNIGTVMALSSNQFTPARDGWVEWSASARDSYQTRLYNVTDTAVVAQGTSNASSAGGVGNSVGGGAVVAGKTYRIELNSSSGTAAPAASRGGGEIHSRVQFWG